MSFGPSRAIAHAHCNLYERKLVRSGRAARLRIAQSGSVNAL